MLTNIEVERVRSHMTKTELAESLGVTIETLSSYVSERTAIPSTALIALSRKFGVSIDYLLGIEESRRAV